MVGFDAVIHIGSFPEQSTQLPSPVDIALPHREIQLQGPFRMFDVQMGIIGFSASPVPRDKACLQNEGNSRKPSSTRDRMIWFP
ncbi:MAG: hypothetical protein DRQ02_10175 [Candidatus Latescibacterota bacterium]|nr:MAG: hypothetical protein DRQ02_10175 [Candidatus Latescibacterota bacterium]RKY69233.1 MAG: hypothetical protein DRQ24_10980 [Candidatus Latescibacterota bacterium]